MDSEQDETQVLETESTEEATETADEATADTQVDEEKEALRKKAEDLEKKNKQLFERIKKAEQPKPTELSQSDLYAAIKADVPEEKISEVNEYAQLKKISFAEALKTSVVRTLLAEYKEEQQTAEATAVGAQRRAPVKITDETLLAQASSGKLPAEDDDAAIARLVEADLKRKQKR